MMKITVIISFLFAAAAFFCPGILMSLLTNEPLLIEGGAEYLQMVAPSYLLTGISQIYLCILKNSGRAKTAGLISSVCMAGNILMNLILILGLFGFPRLEITGAAISTDLARAAEVLWCAAILSKQDSVRLRIKNILHTDKMLSHDFWKYTTPVLGNEIVWGVGFTMYSVIMGHLGSDAVAANSIANIVKNLVCCLCLGIGSGGGILIGNELGAGNLQRGREYGNRLCILSVFAGILSGAVLLAFSPLVLSVTALSDTSAGYLKWMLVICSYYMIGKSVNSTTVVGIFCAGGDSRLGFLCDTIVMWCVTVPLGLTAAFVFRLPVIAVYFIVSLDEFCKLPAVFIHYRKYKWVKDLTNKENS